MTTYDCVSSLPLPYGIRVTTITWLRTTVWAACPCPTAYALLLLHDYVWLCEQLALVLPHTCYYFYITTYYCVSSLPLPYAYALLLLRTVWAACSCPTAYALLLLNDYVLLCEQPALALRHTRYYYYILRTTVWAACPCPTSYALLLLHDYVLLCEQLALALRHTRYYYNITKYYCVSSLPLPYGIRVSTITYYCVSSLLLPYGIRVTTIKWLRSTVWAAYPCPTAYALLLLHHYGLLCEQPSLALRHMRYYYYMTTYYSLSSLPLPYFIRVTTVTWLRTTVWAACPCPTAYELLLQCEQLAFALRHTRYYFYMATYDCVSSLHLPYDIRITTFTWLRTTVWAAFPCPTTYALLLLHDYVRLPLPYGIRVTTITSLRTTVWVACPCPTTYTTSRVYIGISHLWLLYKSMWIEFFFYESNVYDLKLLVHTLSHEFI